MAVASICVTLKNGQDASCIAPVRRYYQQAVVINLNDINPATLVITTPSGLLCSYNVQFALKTGKTGYRFAGSENGSTYKGYFDKSVSDLGFVQYKHNAQILVIGADEASKCVLDALGKGNYAVAFQFSDGVVEIYGIQNGLVAGDFTYDVQEGGGGTPIVLSSRDTAPEGLVPLIYKSLVVGQENEDFDSAFLQA
jgi:hypothetical protein